MSNAAFTAVVLDQPRRIRFSNRARLRMASLDKPFGIEDLSKPKKAFGALCAWLWACMYEADAPASPEDVADTLTDANTADAMRALFDCIKLGMPSPQSPKNDSGESAPSPASNSA
jgi:hypothetical protein